MHEHGLLVHLMRHLQAMLQFNAATRSVQLIADRAYSPGELLTTWCGPQPNSRLLLNYGLVDEVQSPCAG